MKQLPQIFLILMTMFIFSCEDEVVEDTTPPTVNIMTPTNNSEVSDIVTIQITANDENDISFVQVYSSCCGLLGNASSTSGSVYEYNWNTSSLENGQYDVYVIVSDGTNETSSSTISVNIQNEVEITINNNTHSSATYNLGGSNGTINVGSSKTVTYDTNYGNVNFSSTVGSSTICGLVLSLDGVTLYIQTQDQVIDLDVSSNFFFLYLINNSYAYIDDISVDWLEPSEIGCSVNIPNNGTTRSIGYFERTSNPELRAYTDDYFFDSWYFTLNPPNIENSSVTQTLSPILTNNGDEPNPISSIKTSRLTKIGLVAKISSKKDIDILSN